MFRMALIVPALIAVPLLLCGLLFWGDQLFASIPTFLVDGFSYASAIAVEIVLLIVLGAVAGLLLSLDRGGSLKNTFRAFCSLFVVLLIIGVFIPQHLDLSAVIGGAYFGALACRRLSPEHWMRTLFSKQSAQDKDAIASYKRQIEYLDEDRQNLKAQLNKELATRFVSELPDELAAAEALLEKARTVLKAERARFAHEKQQEGDERLPEKYLADWAQHMQYAENACSYSHRSFSTAKFVVNKAIKCFEEGGKHSTVVSFSHMARGELSDIEMNLQEVCPFSKRFR